MKIGQNFTKNWLDLSENCLLIHNCLVPPVLRYHTFYLSDVGIMGVFFQNPNKGGITLVTLLMFNLVKHGCGGGGPSTPTFRHKCLGDANKFPINFLAILCNSKQFSFFREKNFKVKDKRSTNLYIPNLIVVATLNPMQYFGNFSCRIFSFISHLTFLTITEDSCKYWLILAKIGAKSAQILFVKF